MMPAHCNSKAATIFSTAMHRYMASKPTIKLVVATNQEQDIVNNQSH